MSNELDRPGSVFQSGSLEAEKLDPSFRLEDQHMAQELQPVVMGPPPFASPDPATLGGVLTGIEEHPLKASLSEDFGADVENASHTATALGIEADSALDDSARDEWSKADWQRKAKSMGLKTGGSINDLQKRVETAEEEYEEFQARSKEVHAMSRDELDSLAEGYEIDPAEHSSKESLAEAILAAESEPV